MKGARKRPTQGRKSTRTSQHPIQPHTKLEMKKGTVTGIVSHLQSLTWNLKMMISKRHLLFQGLIFRFHVKLQGCKRCNTARPSCQSKGLSGSCCGLPQHSFAFPQPLRSKLGQQGNAGGSVELLFNQVMLKLVE